mgnify:CR=1 FL=1
MIEDLTEKDLKKLNSKKGIKQFLTEENISITEARRVLNEDHYGLDKVKDRIIQHLAVMQLKKDKKGSILLLVGPPGTGKTSVMLRTMVEYLYHHTNEDILLLAYTNRAVDEICEAIESVSEAAFAGTTDKSPNPSEATATADTFFNEIVFTIFLSFSQIKDDLLPGW